jgi:nickel-dependent lactate racemase
LSFGGTALVLANSEAAFMFSQALAQACVEAGKISSVLLIPPDFTRFSSHTGFLTVLAYRELTKAGAAVTVLPALGTHAPINDNDRERMFPGIPKSLFRVHDWRNDVVELGFIEREWIENITEAAVSYDWPVQVNKLLIDGGFDLIVSLGQVVPHEVLGMANHSKNIFIGTGGKESIDKSHYAGAVLGMEKLTGRIDTPTRAMLDEGMRRFNSKLPPVFFVQTVLGALSKAESAATDKSRDLLALRGIFCGFGRKCFEEAAALSSMVNIDLLDEPVQKMVVYLEPEKYRSTWLGNKAMYHTRMAIADNGELLIIAPGLECFGEDIGIDTVIRKYGYRSADVIKETVNNNAELANNLCAAAHLIHGSSEGRFTVRYCSGPGINRNEIESVGFKWGDISEAMAQYDIKKLVTGRNINANGEKFFFVPDPRLGLWALRENFI